MLFAKEVLGGVLTLEMGMRKAEYLSGSARL